MGLDKLNAYANEKFEELKRKQGVRKRIEERQTIEKEDVIESTPTPNENKFHEMYMNPASKKQEESIIEKKEDFIDKINALDLPPNLSLAVSFIVIASKDSYKRFESLRKAVEILDGETS